MPIAFPYKFSDWYGYDQDCAGLTSFYVTTGTFLSATLACDVVATVNLFHNGSNPIPGNGDTVYQNSAGSAKATWVQFKGFSTTFNGSSFSAGRSTNGLIFAAALCP